MGNSALVSLTFDDGLRCQFEKALPILDRYGLSATFFLTANTSPIHIDWYEHPNWRKIEWNSDDVQFLKSMAQRGHEIGSHSVWHKVTDPHHPKFRSDFNPQFEAQESKRLIEGWMDEEISSFCYPFCQRPDALKNAVIAAGYKQARADTNAAYYPLQNPIDHFDVGCRLITEDENVREWVRPNCWHVLMFHGIGTGNDGWGHITVPAFTRQMEELAEHRDAGAVQVVTFRDGSACLQT